ncbi:MAG: fumarylacetoacetate hydrolase family protein [Burkholderiaceae bacterium]
MKFLTFKHQTEPHLGVLLDNERILDLTRAWSQQAHRLSDTAAPTSVGALIRLGDDAIAVVAALVDAARSAQGSPVTALATAELLPPVIRPGKNVFCVGRNYREHIIEGNLARGRDPHDFPKAIEFFSKPPTTVVGHGASVKRHAGITAMLDYEVELGIVIGKRGADIRREDALDHVFGYTIVNDITARDLQALHGQWFKGKGLDTTCPIGPVVAHRSVIANPNALELTLFVNDELRQKANTSDMLFDVSQVIEQLSKGLTLEPGDIIATGTPSGVGFAMTPPRSLAVGDRVRAGIEGIGELVNTIVD